jgi:hypothetical protein
VAISVATAIMRVVFMKIPFVFSKHRRRERPASTGEKSKGLADHLS